MTEQKTSILEKMDTAPIAQLRTGPQKPKVLLLPGENYILKGPVLGVRAQHLCEVQANFSSLNLPVGAPFKYIIYSGKTYMQQEHFEVTYAGRRGAIKVADKDNFGETVSVLLSSELTQTLPEYLDDLYKAYTATNVPLPEDVKRRAEDVMLDCFKHYILRYLLRVGDCALRNGLVVNGQFVGIDLGDRRGPVRNKRCLFSLLFKPVRKQLRGVMRQLVKPHADELRLFLRTAELHTFPHTVPKDFEQRCAEVRTALDTLFPLGKRTREVSPAEKRNKL